MVLRGARLAQRDEIVARLGFPGQMKQVGGSGSGDATAARPEPRVLRQRSLSSRSCHGDKVPFYLIIMLFGDVCEQPRSDTGWPSRAGQKALLRTDARFSVSLYPTA